MRLLSDRSIRPARRETRRHVLSALCGLLVVTSCSGKDSVAPPPPSPVTVTSVAPGNGPPAGGTAVTITGTNFLNVTAVSVGGGALQSMSVVSSTQITGITPVSGSRGAKHVVVSSSSNGSGTCSGCFTYTLPWTASLMTAGIYHSCGLASSGTAYCWGGGIYGQLGNGASNSSATLVAVSGTVTFASLTAGNGHTCGLTSGGVAYCWGDNAYGQLGDATTTQRTTPVAVAGGLTFASLSAGYHHTCGLTSGGVAYCWGRNSSAQLGTGTTTQSATPVAVTGGLSASGRNQLWRSARYVYPPATLTLLGLRDP